MSARAQAYRLPIFGPPDPLLARGWRVAGTIGLVVLAIGLLWPLPRPEPVTAVEPTAERVAKLVLSRSAPPPAAARRPIETAAALPEVAPEPVEAPAPTPAPRVDSRQRMASPVREDRGTVGRTRAREATQQLAATAASIDGMLSGLDQVLAAAPSAPTASATPRRRSARGGRSAAQLGGGGALPATGTEVGDGSGSAIAGARIEIAAIGAIEGEGRGGGGGSARGGAPGGTGTGTGTAGDLRSDASLLAVVRKYAAGIRFCYESELKRNPSLGGKLVVAITVTAAGSVSDATIVQDTLGAAALTSCAIAQIQAWRFPPIPKGDVAFRAPFVFTPPE